MDIRKLIIATLRKKRKIRTADMVKASGFSRAYVNRFLKELRVAGKIALIGKANAARYVLADQKAANALRSGILSVRRMLRNHNLSEDTALEDVKKTTGIFLGLPKNISAILDYAFTEMLNNAIEHSRSEKIEIFMKRTKDAVIFTVSDRGIGIFNNIRKKRGLKNDLEAIQDLLKGKQTTAPREHTGEGIFFTSRVADILTIKSSRKKLIFDNRLDDIFIRDVKDVRGTGVTFIISLGSWIVLSDIFKQYAGRAFAFSKTRVRVALYQMDTVFISRSQARRILVGLEKFDMITLNFKGVDTAGQAFADEIFRVWRRSHPRIRIRYENANENIKFMISRAHRYQ